ncbi:MAG TPA: SIMPL domain-containing protein, partial [Candidatus Saccharimonadales bacterium]|nr:SIMPL domain-containing protein [Candidatus Saccharimonadales bacterium]
SDSNKPKSNKINIKLDTRIVIIVLLVVIIAMLVVWKPWSPPPSSNDRTIAVTGETTVKAEPDEFTFQPNYEFKNADKDAALKQVTEKSEEVIAKLKELGVPDDKIKSDSSGYNYNYYYLSESDQNVYSLRLTVIADNRELAQKVQDYLVTTSPTGTISPRANFSEAKKKELESQARDEATKDARSKAEQSGENLGFKVGAVKTVEDGQNFDQIGYFRDGGATLFSSAQAEDSNKLAVQPGQNDLTYSVKVVYYVK